MNRNLVKRITLPVETVAAVDAIYARIPSVACQGKCVACCCPVGNLMTDFERDRIIQRTGIRPNELPPDVVGTGVKVQGCNLLTRDGKCSVYDIRPTICRIWGADAAIPCKFGCAGAGAMPTAGGKEYVKRVAAVCRRYDSPIPDTVQRGTSQTTEGGSDV